MRRIVKTYSACQWYAAFALTILSIIIIIIIQLLYCFHCSKRSLLLNVIIANQFCSSTLKKSYTFQTNNDACTMRIVINIRSLCHTSCVWSVYTYTQLFKSVLFWFAVPHSELMNGSRNVKKSSLENDIWQHTEVAVNSIIVK